VAAAGSGPEPRACEACGDPVPDGRGGVLPSRHSVGAWDLWAAEAWTTPPPGGRVSVHETLARVADEPSNSSYTYPGGNVRLKGEIGRAGGNVRFKGEVERAGGSVWFNGDVERAGGNVRFKVENGPPAIGDTVEVEPRVSCDADVAVDAPVIAEVLNPVLTPEMQSCCATPVGGCNAFDEADPFIDIPSAAALPLALASAGWRRPNSACAPAAVTDGLLSAGPVCHVVRKASMDTRAVCVELEAARDPSMRACVGSVIEAATLRSG